MPKCGYKHCFNQADDSGFCRAHNDGKANRHKDGIVPDVGTKINVEGNADFATIQKWCEQARVVVNQFLAASSFNSRVSLFFGGNNLKEVRRVFESIPEVLDAWRKGKKKITSRPVMGILKAVNCVDKESGNLNVNPSFVAKMTETPGLAKWVLIHEAAHAVWSINKKTTHVVDHAYYDDGPGIFNNMPAIYRVTNADHYRMCIQRWAENMSVEALTEYAPPVEIASVGPQVAPGRTITPTYSYAAMVKNGAYAVLSVFRLHLFDLMSGSPKKFAEKSALKPPDAKMLRNCLGGKKSSTVKAKDWVRMEDLYGRVTAWQQHIREAAIGDEVDPNLRGMENLQVYNLDGNQTYVMKSYFTNGLPVSDQELARGVRQLVDQVIGRVSPYYGVDGEYVASRVRESRRQERKPWFSYV